MGTIFDAQPSASQTNIHCLEDPQETVLGFISVTNIQRKRVYVNKIDLRLTVAPAITAQCRLDTLYFCPITPCGAPCELSFIKTDGSCGPNEVALYLVPPGAAQIPVGRYFKGPFDSSKETIPSAYLSSGIECIDCSTRGATKPPPFWRE